MNLGAKYWDVDMQARKLLRSGEYQEAIEYLNRALKQQPGENLNQALKEEPGRRVLRTKAAALLLVGNKEAALRCYEQLLEISPDDPGILSEKGDILLDMGRFRDAAKCYEKATHADPSSFQAADWALKGDKLYRSGQIAESELFYDKSLAFDTENAWAWRGKGLVLSRKHTKLQEALSCFDSALKIEPNNAWLWVDKGGVLFAQRKYGEATGCYDRAIELDPQYFLAWFNRAALERDQNRYEQAIKFYDRAIQVEPRNSEAWLEKGYCLVLLNRPEESIECFDQAIQSSPRSVWAWNNKGWALAQLGRHDEAISCFDKAIELNSREELPWRNKSLALLQQNRPEDARRCLEAAIRAVGNRLGTLSMLAFFLSDYLFEPKEALKIYLQALRINPKDVGTKASIAECLIKVGRYREGREFAKQVTSGSTDVVKQQVMRYLRLVSYALEGNASRQNREFGNFLGWLRTHDTEASAATDSRWYFGGLIETIMKSRAPLETKFLLLTLIDLQQGRVATSSMSFFSGRVPVLWGTPQPRLQKQRELKKNDTESAQLPKR